MPVNDEAIDARWYVAPVRVHRKMLRLAPYAIAL